MAKRHPLDVSVSPASKTLQVEAAALAIETAYSLGKQIGKFIAAERSRSDTKNGYSKSLIEQAQAKFSATYPILTSADKTRKIRQFADTSGPNATGYRKSEISSLCRMARQTGYVLRLTSLLRLLTVMPRFKRMEMAERMIEKNWTVTEVTQEIRRVRRQQDSKKRPKPDDRPVRRGVGQKFRKPKSKQQVEDEFVALATRWINYDDFLNGDTENTKHMKSLTPNQQDAIQMIGELIRTHAHNLGCDAETLKRYAGGHRAGSSDG